MKYLISAISAALLATILPLPALAGFWGFERRLANESAISHDEIVELIYNAVTIEPEAESEAEPEVDANGVPRSLRPMYEALFEPPAVEIPFRVTVENDAARHTLQSGVMYYSQGELFVQVDADEGTDTGLYNFATIDGELYTWKTGDTEGDILTRFTGDTVELVDYLTNPALIKSSFFNQYHDSPEDFTMIEGNGFTTLQPNDLSNGFGGVRLTQAPWWLSGMILYNCDIAGCSDINLAGDRLVMEVDAPIPLEAIPADVQTLPEGVTFWPSDNTVDRFLTYL